VYVGRNLFNTSPQLLHCIDARPHAWQERWSDVRRNKPMSHRLDSGGLLMCTTCLTCIIFCPPSRTPRHVRYFLQHTSPPRTTTNILPQPIPTNLLPLNLLPRNRQLPPQTLERTLTQLPKRLVQILLILLLRRRNLPDHVPLTHPAQADLLVRQQPHIAIFVVVHVNFDAAGQRG
jgi:hypothetical protein